MSHGSLAFRLRPSPAILSALLAASLVASVVSGCGKKGPPLPPLLRLPAPIADFSARRLGSTVYIRFTVPTKNQDNSTPADLARVEVYGYTGTPRTDEDLLKNGTLVATALVRRPPTPEEQDREREKETNARKNGGEAGTKPKPPKPQPKPREPEPGFDQGATITIVETLSPALMQPVAAAAPRRSKPLPDVRPPLTMPVASFGQMPTRIYVAVGVNHKGRRSAFSPRIAVPLGPPPSAPADLKVAYTESQISLTWTPPPGAPIPTVPPLPKDPADPDEPEYLPRKPVAGEEGLAWTYDVFEVAPKGAANAEGATSPAPPGNPPHVDAPLPLNQQPVTVATFSDPNLQFGTERCYAVRTIVGVGKVQQASEPSEPVCVTPRDVFPPAAPKNLIGVASAGTMSLSWEPNSETDLAGYLVLRAAADATLQPLMREPIHETTYDDKTVKPGVRYSYAIVAVDKVGNISAQSNRVEETAR